MIPDNVTKHRDPAGFHLIVPVVIEGPILVHSIYNDGRGTCESNELDTLRTGQVVTKTLKGLLINLKQRRFKCSYNSTSILSKDCKIKI